MIFIKIKSKFFISTIFINKRLNNINTFENNFQKMGKSKYHILLVDDEPDIREFLTYNLEREGYKVSKAKNGVEAVAKVKKSKPDLILMDIMMPKMDGLTAIKKIRELKGADDIIVVFLTARSEELSQIAGFEAGADDYVSKPVQPKVLMHRIKALLRRLKKEETKEAVRKMGKLTIDTSKYIVSLDGKEIFFPRKEFELLNMLSSKPDKVFGREEILSKVWGKEVVVGDRTIDVHIRKIREKLGNDIIVTIKGVGYKFIQPG